MARKKQSPENGEFQVVLNALIDVAAKEVAHEQGIDLDNQEDESLEIAPSDSSLITNEEQRRRVLDEVHHKVTIYFNRILDEALKDLDKSLDSEKEEIVRNYLSPQMLAAITKFLKDNNATLGIITPQSPMGNLLSKLPYNIE